MQVCSLSAGSFLCFFRELLVFFLFKNKVMAEREVNKHSTGRTTKKGNNGIMACDRPYLEKCQNNTTVNDEAGQVGEGKTNPLLA